MTSNAPTMPRDPGADDHDDVRNAGIQRAIGALRGGDARLLATPGSRRAWISSLTPDRFLGFLRVSNALLRDRDPETHTFDGGNVATFFMLPPAEPDRQHLLKETLSAVQRVAADPTLTDDAACRRIGLLFAGSINLVHAFGNGNGRLGRFVSCLLDRGFNGSSEAAADLSAAALASRNWQTTPPPECERLTNRLLWTEVLSNLDPKRPTSVFNEAAGGLAGEYSADDFSAIPGLAPEQRSEAASALNGGSLAHLALGATLARRGPIPAELIIEEHGRTFLRAIPSVAALGPEGVSEWLGLARACRARRVELFLHEMSRPDAATPTPQNPEPLAKQYADQLVNISALLHQPSHERLGRHSRSPLQMTEAPPLLTNPSSPDLTPRSAARRWSDTRRSSPPGRGSASVESTTSPPKVSRWRASASGMAGPPRSWA